MKKLITFILLALLPMLASAYDAEINGIYYNFSGNEAEVTYQSTNYNSYSGSVTIPSTVVYNGKTYTVTSIGNYAFRDCISLTSITIPSSVASIGKGAFYYCNGLQKVIVPDIAAWCSITFGVESFSDYSDSNPLYYAKHLYCDKNTEITDLVIPNSVTCIGNFTFENCISLTSVTIPNSVASIGESAFYNCSGLKSITIPNSVTTIGRNAFNGCI